MNTLKIKWYNLVFDKKQWIAIGMVILTLLATIWLGITIPIAVNDLYLAFEKKSNFYPSVYFLLSLFIGEYFLKVINQAFVNHYIAKVLGEIRLVSFTNFLYSYESEDKKGLDSKTTLGQVLSRIVNDSAAIMELISSGSFAIILDFFFIISCLMSFLTLDAKIGGSLIVIEVVFCFFLVYLSRYIKVVFNSIRVITGKLTRILADVIKNFKHNYYFKKNNYIFTKTHEVFEEFLNMQLKANIWDALYYSLSESLFPLILAIIVLLIPYVDLPSFAILAVVIDLIQRSIGPIKEIAGKISAIQRAKTGVDRLVSFNNEVYTKNSPLPEYYQFFANNQHIQCSHQEIDQNLDYFNFKLNFFQYENSPHQKRSKQFKLEKINFSILKGSSLGIVGKSGCGKSTLLRILAGTYESADCQFEFGFHSGVERKNFSTRLQTNFIKSKISLITQDSFLFTQSLRFNITLGLKEEEFEQFWSMVQEKIEYLKSWDYGPEDVIGVNEISLGQKQLICALRSCYLKKEIVLYDEISSSLDNRIEKALKEVMKIIMEHSCFIIVSHRLETILGLNQVMFMVQGQVKGKGSPEELMTNNLQFNQFIQHLNL